MSTTYTYSLSGDFGGNIKPRRLQNTINDSVGVTQTITEINVIGDVVDIIVDGSLTAGEITAMNNIIASHDAGANPLVNLKTEGAINSTATLTVNQTGNRTISLPDATDMLVGENVSQKLQNKKLITANTEFADPSDNTKVIKLDTSSANTGTSTTLKGTQSGNRTITLPDADDTLVGENVSQNLSNKKLVDSSSYFVNVLDSTKEFIISLGNATSNTNTTIQSQQTGNRVITLPDATTTLVGTNISQTLTNKTIDADSNTVSNIDNGDIKTGAAIDASKIADGTVSNTEFQYLNNLSSNIQAQLNTLTAALTTKICDLYHKPVSVTSFTSVWTDVPMNIERTIDSNFTHVADSAEITIVNTDNYLIIAKCSTYNTTRTRSGSQFRLVRNGGGGYAPIEGTLGYLYNRYNGFLGYDTCSTPVIMTLNAGDKIKMQVQVIQGTTTLYVSSEGASIVIKSV